MEVAELRDGSKKEAYCLTKKNSTRKTLTLSQATKELKNYMAG
jgi:hypothetical protein